MSLKVIKAGILDSIQDTGRFGYRKYGINPSGAMDVRACKLANHLLGNATTDAVIELHFPASTFLFEKTSTISITGGDFTPMLDGYPVPMNQPVVVPPKATLRFDRPVHGSRAYLGMSGGIDLPRWLGSYSTHFKAVMGGMQGRRLQKGDIIILNDLPPEKIPGNISFRETPFNQGEIFFIPGPEWDWISVSSKQRFGVQDFRISSQSDRMGYRLVGDALEGIIKEELISSPVTFGTVQLLPDGSLIILMADHQTSGGYPRLGTVITAHHSVLAQKKPGDSIRFKQTDIATAEHLANAE